MEGARWDITQSVITDSRLKELYPSLPVINIRVRFNKKNSLIFTLKLFLIPGSYARQTRQQKHV